MNDAACIKRQTSELLQKPEGWICYTLWFSGEMLTSANSFEKYPVNPASLQRTSPGYQVGISLWVLIMRLCNHDYWRAMMSIALLPIPWKWTRFWVHIFQWEHQGRPDIAKHDFEGFALIKAAGHLASMLSGERWRQRQNSRVSDDSAVSSVSLCSMEFSNATCKAEGMLSPILFSSNIPMMLP